MPAEPPAKTAGQGPACLGPLLGGNVCPVLALRKVLSQRHAGGAPRHARHGARHGAQAGQRQEGAGEQRGGKLQRHPCTGGAGQFAVEFNAQFDALSLNEWRQRLQHWVGEEAACY